MTEYKDPKIESVLNVVDTYLRAKAKRTSGNRRYDYYHPSEFGGCLRYAQYKKYADMGLIEVIEEEHESKMIRLFDKGHNMHERWNRYFQEAGVLRGYWKCKNPLCNTMYGKENKIGVFEPKCCEKCSCEEFEYVEVSVRDEELGFGGHCDLILDFSKIKKETFEGVERTFNLKELPKKPIIADMKTVNDRGFKKVLKEGPPEKYITQLTIYTHVLDCDFGLLIYENKDNSLLEYFEIPRNEEKFEKIAWQAKTMTKMSESEDRLLPPPKPAKIETYAYGECKYCSMLKLCERSRIWDDPSLNEKRKHFYGE